MEVIHDKDYYPLFDIRCQPFLRIVNGISGPGRRHRDAAFSLNCLINIRYGLLTKSHQRRYRQVLRLVYQSFHEARPLHDEILLSYPIYFTTNLTSLHLTKTRLNSSKIILKKIIIYTWHLIPKEYNIVKYIRHIRRRPMNRVKEFRKELGISQLELIKISVSGDRCNLWLKKTTSTIQPWNSVSTSPTAQKLISANLLGGRNF